MIRIGVDLHGVVDRNIYLFKCLSESLLFSNLLNDKGEEEGIKVYIISGPPKKEVIEELLSMGIYHGVHYTDVYTIVDFLQSQPDVKMWKDDKNTWWTDDESWWGAKAKICKQLGINIMIDNTDKYKSYFKGTGIKFIIYDDMA